MVAGLRALAWGVTVHAVPGRFPDVDTRARNGLDGALGRIPDGALVVLDGLAMGALPEVVEAHARRLRLVALVHHPLGDETGLGFAARERFLALEGRALAAVAGVVVTGPFTARRLARMGVGRDVVRVVEPGTERPAAAGRRLGDPPLLLSVGTVTPRKGHDVLVAALGRIRDLPWRCVCAGSLERDPAFAARVRVAAGRAGVEDRLELPGELEPGALEALYQEASLFVLASHYEGHGMARAEALVRGLPVVSTTGGAIPHTVPAEAGVLVPPGDAGALARGLRGLLEDPGRREALGAAALAHASTLPGWDTQVRTFAAAVTELAGGEPTLG